MSQESTNPNWPAALDHTEPRFRFCFEDTQPGYALQPRTTLPGTGKSAPHRYRSFVAEVRVLPLNGRLPTMMGQAFEITHRGLFVHSQASLRTGTLVLLEVSSDLGKICFTAEIVQAIPSYGVGCSFVDLDDRQRAALSLMVAVSNSAPEDARTISCEDTLPPLTVH